MIAKVKKEEIYDRTSALLVPDIMNNETHFLVEATDIGLD
jgi:hypothetical protein